MKIYKDKIAIIIENMTQFQTLKNGIKEILKKNIELDIYIPKLEDSWNGFKQLFDNTYEKILKEGLGNVKRQYNNEEYKILLEPYPTEYFLDIKYKYRIKYKYSILSAKPDPTYKPEWNMYYDTILCYGKYEADILSAYTNTDIICNMKYLGYNAQKNNNHEGKKTLLYLPTYGANSDIDRVIKELETLKKEYKVITKLHHGTTFLENEKSRVESIKEVADEIYESDTNIVELLSKSDVVLSDNSGAIFEAIYAEVPVAICSNEINKKLIEFTTPQYDLIQKKVIPYTNEPKKISEILLLAMNKSTIKKQKNIKSEFFISNENIIMDFINIIEQYLNDDINIKRKQLHDLLVKEFVEKNDEILKMSEIIRKQENDIQKKDNIINNKEKSINEVKNKNNEILSENLELKRKILEYEENDKKTLYRISKKIYNIMNEGDKK